ncbi:hypothetical protein P7C71_g3652, partial [Lecanoromycetidae sp. Uapishka_2]
MKLLLKAGARVNEIKVQPFSEQTYRTALHAAVVAGRHSEFCVRVLLEHGAKPDTTDLLGETPIYAAARQNNEKVVALLLKYGADPDRATGRCGNALRVAALNGLLNIVKPLVEAGASLNMSDSGDGGMINPLRAAISHHHDLVVDNLLERGARISLQQMANRRILRKAIANAVATRDPLVIEKFLTHGLRVRCRLSVASQLEMVEQVRVMVAEGDDEELYQYVKAEVITLEEAQIRMDSRDANELVDQVCSERNGEGVHGRNAESFDDSMDDTDVYDEDDEMLPFNWGL